MAKKKAKKLPAPAPDPPPPKPKKRLGRPRIVIDERVLEGLARVNCTYEEIAGYFGISKSTLHKRYRTRIEAWRNGNKTSLRRMQWAMAMGKPNAAKPSGFDRLPNIRMLVWLGKQELDQREPERAAIDQNKDGPEKPVTGKDLLEKEIVFEWTVVPSAD